MAAVAWPFIGGVAFTWLAVVTGIRAARRGRSPSPDLTSRFEGSTRNLQLTFVLVVPIVGVTAAPAGAEGVWGFAQAIVVGGWLVSLGYWAAERYHSNKWLPVVVQIAAASLGAYIVVSQISVHANIQFNPAVLMVLGAVWMIVLTQAFILVEKALGLAFGQTLLAAGAGAYLALQAGLPWLGAMFASMAGGALGAILVQGVYLDSPLLHDAGSAWLGYMFGGLSLLSVLQADANIAPTIWLLLLGLPIVFALFVRSARNPEDGAETG